ncbi:MAG: dihydroorotase [Lewinellaceae bacterium]|nr:dihydroorotase [Lewinellaceae bacterium]
MDLLIKNAKIINPGGPHHGVQRDLFIREGKIEAIETEILVKDVPVLEGSQLQVSIGWMDIGVQTGDPGLEQREDLSTVGAAAAAGGFTAISCQPNTDPAIHSKSEVLYVQNNTQRQLVAFYPIGAITRNCAGKDLTEMIDMHASGAVAFSDGKKPVQDGGLMMRALQYVQAFNGLAINQPLDRHIANEGQMHEGLTSTSLGMKGIPAIAEEIMVQRDLHLLAYTGSRLHLANLSTAGAVERVRQAKAQGLNVTASVAVMNLAFDDTALDGYDVNFKVMPPLRSRADVDALKEGLLDGTIDVISANHVPLEEELKKVEFPYAQFGAIGLETMYAVCKTYLGDWLSDELFVEKVAINPRKLFGVPVPVLEKGQYADLAVFSPTQQWAYRQELAYSRSHNSPFFGRTFTGKPVAVINRDQSFISRYR